MTHFPDDFDPRLADGLRETSPPAAFDAAAVRARVERSVAAAPVDRIAVRPRRDRSIVQWTARAAAAIVLFGLGAWVGRASAPDTDLPVVPVFGGLTGASLPPAQVPMSIQSAGTGYVASLAMLAEMRHRLTPEQREQARQVALAVLTGAIAELAAAGDGRLPNGVLHTVLSYGVPTGGPADPVMRYR